EHLKQQQSQRTSQRPNNWFTDPTQWLVETYPWTDNTEWSDHLNRLRLEDIEDDLRRLSTTTTSVAVGQSSISPSSGGGGEQSNEDIDQIKDPFVSDICLDLTNNWTNLNLIFSF